MRNVMEFLGVMLAIVVVIAVIVGTIVCHALEWKHEDSVKHTAIFGQHYDLAKDFVLTKGTSVTIHSEVGPLLVCLPEDGRPAVMVDSDKEKHVPQGEATKTPK